MPDNLYTRFSLPRIINGVGYATRVGGGVLHEAVLDAMREAGQVSIEIDAIQSAASECIARHTGAEAGIVTCGAAAALTLAAAACLAGNDPDRMDQLPVTDDLPRNRIIYPRPGRYDYDHAIRLSGAVLDLIDYDQNDALEQIQKRIGPKTAAIGYVWQRTGQHPTISAVAAIAHQYDLPLIVDGALSLPPVEHLQSFIREGAELVAISGGKHLGGPQASGLLFGRRELVQSAWVQMVDMDVRSQTWSLQYLIDSGWITRPPRHGIGRSMKVSKEAILGCLTALERYALRDHVTERVVWQQRIDRLHEGLTPMQWLETKKLFPARNGQPYPVLHLQYSEMPQMLNAMRLMTPRIILAEDESDPSIACIYPMCLSEDDVDGIINAVVNFAQTLVTR
ncbi:MAG: aminotransferase class V-fold PLP-dependent enzyme [Phycisphaerales bacterium]|nr:aminotransferase class V-fold PLP-dependent enzyme [Phycisphaerales bacterium]